MASIYERPPRSLPYTITTGGAPLNEWLGGWEANSVIVDNHAGQHVLLPDVGIYCPPLTVGKVVPLPSKGRVQAQFATPPGLVVPSPPAGQIATLTFFAEDLAPHPGVPDGAINTTSPVQTLRLKAGDSGIYQVTSTGLQTFAFTIPPGAQSARFAVLFGGISFTGWKVFGNNSQSMGNYWTLADQTTATGTVSDTTFRLHAMDTVLTLSFTATGLGAGTFTFLAEANQSAGDLVAEIEGPVGVLSSSPFTVNNINAALWQAPNLLPIDTTSALAAGASQTVVAGVGGQSVYVHTIQGTFDSTEAALDYAVQDGSTIRGRLSLVTIGPHFQDWKGSKLTSGNPLVYKNEGTVTHVFRGTQTASQG